MLSSRLSLETAGIAFQQEWNSLSQESDSELRAEGLLHLAHRIESRGGAESENLAASLYQSLSESEDAPRHLRDRAATRLQVLAGGGPWGAQAERLLRNFTGQVTDPAMLVGMGLAGGAFQVARFSVLARFSAAPTAGTLTRGWGARILASTAGLAVEAPVFTAATRLGHAALGRGLDPSPQAWMRELASAYLMLGTLKSVGGMSGALWPRAASPNQFFLRGLYSQSTLLGGLFLVHRAEEGLGWRPAQGLAANLTDSLATLAQFYAAGRLSRGLLGERFGSSLRELEIRAEALPQSGLGRARPSLDSFGPALAWQGAMDTFSARPAEAPRPELSGLVFAMSHGRNGRGGVSLHGERLGQLAEPEMGSAADSFEPRRGRSAQPKVKSIGILTSGGDGPAENAAIEALVRGASLVQGWKVYGILDGYRGLLEPEGRIRELTTHDVRGDAAIASALRLLYGDGIPPPLKNIFATDVDISRIGGTILRSSRTNPVRNDPEAATVKNTMSERGIDALVVLGGNGSMRAAAELHKAGVPLVGIPQSIDGDIWGSEHSIGFPSAVAKGVSEVHHYLTTAHSCGRWFLVEVMGQRYGLLTLAIAERSGVTDAAFTEVPRNIEDLRRVVERRRPERQHGVILISEGVKFLNGGVSLIEPPRGTDAHGRLLNEPGDVAHWVRRMMAERQFETQTRSESLGYLLRGADTSEADRLLANHFAVGALKLVSRGRFGHMVGTVFPAGSSTPTLRSVPLMEVAKNEKEPPADYHDYVRGRLEGD